MSFFVPMKRNQPARDMLKKVAEHPTPDEMTLKSLMPPYALSDGVYSRVIRNAQCLDYLPTREHGHHNITQVFEPSLPQCEEKLCPWLKLCPMINKELF
jgi:hypothetical protein